MCCVSLLNPSGLFTSPPHTSRHFHSLRIRIGSTELSMLHDCKSATSGATEICIHVVVPAAIITFVFLFNVVNEFVRDVDISSSASEFLQSSRGALAALCKFFQCTPTLYQKMVCLGSGISPLVMGMLLSDPALACGPHSKSGRGRTKQHALPRHQIRVDILEVRLTLSSHLQRCMAVVVPTDG